MVASFNMSCVEFRFSGPQRRRRLDVNGIFSVDMAQMLEDGGPGEDANGEGESAGPPPEKRVRATRPWKIFGKELRVRTAPPGSAQGLCTKGDSR